MYMSSFRFAYHPCKETVKASLNSYGMVIKKTLMRDVGKPQLMRR